MTEEQIWQWQADMFVLSCLLYEEGPETVLSDADFDEHCQRLVRSYDRLPQAFRDRVDLDRLTCGTAMGLTYTEAERLEARAWLRRARDPLWWEAENRLQA